MASWMTREDREEAIADNLAYVSSALEQVPHDESTRVVHIGFSQGVAMAFRAGVLGPVRTAGIAAVGGDVPPELFGTPIGNFQRYCSCAARATSGSRSRDSIGMWPR